MSEKEWRDLARQVYETGDLGLAKKLVTILERLATPLPSVSPTLKLVDLNKDSRYMEFGFSVGVWLRCLRLASVIRNGRASRFIEATATVQDLANGLAGPRSQVYLLGSGAGRAKAVAFVRAAGLEAPDKRIRSSRRRPRISEGWSSRSGTYNGVFLLNPGAPS